MVDGRERTGVGHATSKHVKSTAVAHDAAGAAVAFKDWAQGAESKGKSEDVVGWGTAMGDVSDRRVERQGREGVVSADEPCLEVRGWKHGCDGVMASIKESSRERGLDEPTFFVNRKSKDIRGKTG